MAASCRQKAVAAFALERTATSEARDQIGPFEHAAHPLVVRPGEHVCHRPVRTKRLPVMSIV